MQNKFLFDLDEQMTKDLADLTDRLYGRLSAYMEEGEWSKSCLRHFNNLVRYWVFADMDAVSYFDEELADVVGEHSSSAARSMLARLIDKSSRRYPLVSAAIDEMKDEWSRIYVEDIADLYCGVDMSSGNASIRLKMRGNPRRLSHELRKDGAVKSFYIL